MALSLIIAVKICKSELQNFERRRIIQIGRVASSYAVELFFYKNQIYSFLEMSLINAHLFLKVIFFSLANKILHSEDEQNAKCIFVWHFMKHLGILNFLQFSSRRYVKYYFYKSCIFIFNIIHKKEVTESWTFLIYDFWRIYNFWDVLNAISLFFKNVFLSVTQILWKCLYRNS